MRKVLLVYLYGEGEAGISLALGYLKAHADADEEIRRTFSIEILHRCVTTDPRAVIHAIERCGAEVVGFSCYSWNYLAVSRIVSLLPARDRPLVVLGGVEVTPRPVAVLREVPQADAVVVGEGEETFRDLLRRLAESLPDRAARNLAGIAGLVWRAGAAIRTNPPRPPILDLASIPSPYLAGSFGDELRRIKRVPLESTRGCPFRCAYCFEARGFKRVRAFPLERVKAEVAHLVKLGVPEIEFFDTNVNYDRRRAAELFRFLGSVTKRVNFWFEFRAELLDAEQIQALAALRFFAEAGLQTTNPRALQAVRRTFDREKFQAAITALMEASIYRPCAFSPRLGVMIDLIAGLPHDRVADVLRSFDFAFGLVPSKIAVSLMKLLPGTEVHEQARRYRYEYDPHDNHVIRSSATLSRAQVAELNGFSHAAYAAYNTIHAVRTIGWTATRLALQPSAVFLEIGRDITRSGRPWEHYTVKDLSATLVRICREHGDEEAARQVVSKLVAETVLNVLQKIREKRRSWWRRAVFAVGYRLLRRFGGLAPLPVAAAPEVRRERPPTRRAAPVHRT
ncbi:MAG: cobalamin-dependent protein [Planctomycetes bacterium]|nr:cobalamin-dependent protein [Planctomycetota bacterium]